MLKRLRNYLAKTPGTFALLRKIIELNFKKERELIARVFNKFENKKILDIGCGTGEFSRMFQGAQYTGIDISPDYIQFAKRRKSGEFSVMDATNLSFQDNFFDGVLVMAILHHLPDEDAKKVLEGAKRVMKEKGRIVIIEDSKIPPLETPIVRLAQKFDVGEYIRTPDEYFSLLSKYFMVQERGEFRNGACVYSYFVAEK